MVQYPSALPLLHHPQVQAVSSLGNENQCMNQVHYNTVEMLTDKCLHTDTELGMLCCRLFGIDHFAVTLQKNIKSIHKKKTKI